MATQSSQSFAARLGYGLGRGVRFFLVDENVVVRWVKRCGLAILLLFVTFNLPLNFAGELITVLVVGVAAALLTRVSASKKFTDDKGVDLTCHPSIPRNGKDGYGYYDSYGNFRGSNNPFDD